MSISSLLVIIASFQFALFAANSTALGVPSPVDAFSCVGSRFVLVNFEPLQAFDGQVLRLEARLQCASDR